VVANSAAISVLLGAQEYVDFQEAFPSTYLGIGVPPSDQANIINDMGIGVSATYSQGTRGDLITNLKNGLPTVVSVAWTDANVGHALLVTGYDPKTSEFNLFDPGRGLVSSESSFQSYYGVSFNQAWLNQPNVLIPAGSMVTLQRNNDHIIIPQPGGGGGMRGITR